MMSELQVVKSAKFGEIQTDIYQKGSEPYMTAEQLGACLGYENGRKGIDNLVARNEYLVKNEFSVTLKLRATDGKTYNTRVFTEDGIYEITLLAKTEKAKEFRSWVRKLLKSLRKGETKLIGMTDYQRMVAQTRVENVKVRKAQLLERLANQYDGTFKQVLHAHATKELSGEYLLPLPRLEKRTYSASEIAEELCTTSNKVGRIANSLGLKTDKYGAWFNDKAKNSTKEIQTFRYYDHAIDVIKDALGA